MWISILDPPYLVPVVPNPIPTNCAVEIDDQEHHAQIQFDWAQDLVFAEGEPISQEAIKAGIQAAGQYLLARSAAVLERTSPSTMAAVRSIDNGSDQLGTSVPPHVVIRKPHATEESRRHDQMKHFNHLHHPEFTDKDIAIEVVEWIR